MKKKICNYQGCNALIDHSEAYCPKHERELPPPFSGAVRYNESMYKTSRWRSLRAEVLREQTTCFKCGTEFELEVHHLVPPRGNEELFFDENNLVAVCPACHKVITNREIRNRRVG